MGSSLCTLEDKPLSTALNGEITNCSVVSDCTTIGEEGQNVFRVCYINPSFAEEEGSFCDCPVRFGFTGNDCDIPTFQTYYMRTAQTTFAIWGGIIALLFIVVVGRHVVRILKLRRIALSDMNSAFAATLFFLLASGMFSISGSLALLSTFDVRKLQITCTSVFGVEDEAVSVRHSKASFTLLALSFNWVTLATILISVTWLNAAHTVWAFWDNNIKRWIERFKRFVYYFTYFYMTVSAVHIALGLNEILAGVTVIMVFLLIILFWKARQLFLAGVAQLSSTKMEDRKLSEAVKIIEQASRVHLILLVVYCVAFIVYAIFLVDFDSHVEPGSFLYPILIRDIGSIAGLIMASYNVPYLEARLRLIIKHEAKSQMQVQTVSPSSNFATTRASV